MRQLVHAFKYGGRRDVLAPLGRRLSREARIGSLGLVDRRPVVVAVPARGPARRRRGYDQAVLLAAAFARARRLPWAPRALCRRRRGGTAQAGSSIARRRAHVRGAFRARPREIGRRPVLLVDDVLSTGATADAATRALLCAGAESVTVLVLAT